jgi:hypothetical protein
VRAGWVPSKAKPVSFSSDVEGRSRVDVEGMAERGKGEEGWRW